MQSTDWIVLGMTFVTGVMAGSFIYFTGLKPVDIDPDQSVTPYLEDVTFRVSVAEYGGCVYDGCRSYQLTDDGSFTMIDRDGSSIRGQLSAVRLQEVKVLATGFDFAAQAAPAAADACQSYADGVDVTYRVAFDQQNYFLDTCVTSLKAGDPFIAKLDELMLDFANE